MSPKHSEHTEETVLQSMQSPQYGLFYMDHGIYITMQPYFAIEETKTQSTSPKVTPNWELIMLEQVCRRCKGELIYLPIMPH